MHNHKPIKESCWNSALVVEDRSLSLLVCFGVSFELDYTSSSNSSFNHQIEIQRNDKDCCVCDFGRIGLYGGTNSSSNKKRKRRRRRKSKAKQKVDVEMKSEKEVQLTYVITFFLFRFV
ncbi:hypothetical protein RFI_32473, partial [Reticulomyxa filosa]